MMLALADLVGIKLPFLPRDLYQSLIIVAIERWSKCYSSLKCLERTIPATHQQWDTIRKLRTSYTKGVQASGASNALVTSVCGGEGKDYQRLSDDPCASLWFMRFVTGCMQTRMD